MTLINIFGSTGIIGSKSLKIIKDCFPEIKLNLLLAKSNYKKICNQVRIYKPKYVCLTDNSKYKLLKEELNGIKIKILMAQEISDFLKQTNSNMTILCISGYSSLNFIEPIIINTDHLGLVSKECIVAGGRFIKKFCDKYNTKLHALDSEHYSIQNYINQKNNLNNKFINNIFLTASGGPFLNKDINNIQNVSLKKALKHPKWNMGIKNSIDSATLVNKCLEVIEAHYLFNIKYEKLKILIHPESLVHSIIEYSNYTTTLNYFFHDMFIPLHNFLKINSKVNKNIFPKKNFEFKIKYKIKFYKTNVY